MNAAFSGMMAGIERAPPIMVPHMSKRARRKYEEAERLASRAYQLIREATEIEEAPHYGLKRGNPHLEAIYLGRSLQEICWHMARGAVVGTSWSGLTRTDTYANRATHSVVYESREQRDKHEGWDRDRERETKAEMLRWRELDHA